MTRGFLLISSLLLCVLLLTLGLGIMGSRSRFYEASSQNRRAAQARALAEAGFEDARVKLMKDYDFPPLGADDQALFSYHEAMPDVGGGPVIGGYVVTLDSTYRQPPYRVERITATGYLGPRDNPTAVHKIEAELDLSQTDRQTGAPPNPNLFQLLNYREGRL